MHEACVLLQKKLLNTLDDTISDIVARTDKMKEYSYFVSDHGIVSIAWFRFARRDCDDTIVL